MIDLLKMSLQKNCTEMLLKCHLLDWSLRQLLQTCCSWVIGLIIFSVISANTIMVFAPLWLFTSRNELSSISLFLRMAITVCVYWGWEWGAVYKTEAQIEGKGAWLGEWKPVLYLYVLNCIGWIVKISFKYDTNCVKNLIIEKAVAFYIQESLEVKSTVGWMNH